MIDNHSHIGAKSTDLNDSPMLIGPQHRFLDALPAGTGKWLLIDAALAAGYGMTDDQVLITSWHYRFPTVTAITVGLRDDREHE